MSTSSPKILITGANGQLGHALTHHALASTLHLIPCTRDILDITNASSIEKALAMFSPDIIINAAAYTAVDKAEQETEMAMRINHIGAERLARACKTAKIPIIHISTDYVFSGDKNTPYHETDATQPLGVYGESKLRGEHAVRDACDKHIILRVSGVFSEYKNNFAKTIVRLASERKELRIVADQITCPTYAGDIAQALLTIAANPQHTGTYHYCGAEPVSWYEFACAIVEVATKHKTLSVENIIPITTAEYPTLAKRPAYSVLDCEKIKRDYHIPQHSWRSALTAAKGIYA